MSNVPFVILYPHRDGFANISVFRDSFQCRLPARKGTPIRSSAFARYMSKIAFDCFVVPWVVRACDTTHWAYRKPSSLALCQRHSCYGSAGCSPRIVITLERTNDHVCNHNFPSQLRSYFSSFLFFTRMRTHRTK